MILASSIMYVSITFGAALVGLAIVLMWISEPDHRTGDPRGVAAEEHTFFQRQFKRRKRLNWLIAITGIAVILSPLISLPALKLAYWSGIALVVLWIGFLAFLDFIASYMFLQSIRTRQRATRMAIESQYNRLRDRDDAARDTSSHGHDSQEKEE